MRETTEKTHGHKKHSGLRRLAGKTAAPTLTDSDNAVGHYVELTLPTNIPSQPENVNLHSMNYFLEGRKTRNTFWKNPSK